MKKREAQPPKTLFDPKVFQGLGNDYPSGLERTFSKTRLLESDVEIFQDLSRYDVGDFYPTAIAGPVALNIAGRLVNCSQASRKSVQLTGSVESDRVQLRSVQAKGVLYVEIGTLYERLCEVRAWSKTGLILISGYGIPRPQTRRLLHRLSLEFKLPVYVLTDNDTWGYFIFSVLKRGSIAPDRTTPELAVQDVRFLGHRAGELKRRHDSKHYSIPWQPHWELRLRAMAKYPCFRSQKWQAEFKNFRAQGGKYEGAALAYGLMGQRTSSARRVWSNYVDQYLLPKLQRSDWLS